MKPISLLLPALMTVLLATAPVFWRGNFPTENSRGDYLHIGLHGSAVGSP